MAHRIQWHPSMTTKYLHNDYIVNACGNVIHLFIEETRFSVFRALKSGMLVFVLVFTKVKGPLYLTTELLLLSLSTSSLLKIRTFVLSSPTVLAPSPPPINDSPLPRLSSPTTLVLISFGIVPLLGITATIPP